MAWTDYEKFANPVAGIQAVNKGAKSLFSGGPSAMNAAQPYLNQIAPMAHEQFSPYINQGQTAGQAAGQTYGQMAQNPADFYNDLFSKYSTSRGFEYSRDQAMKNAQNAAAQGGFSGTQYDQQQQAELANALGSQNMQQWMQNVMGMQNTGLAGQQHMADTGYAATNDLASMLGQTLGAQGGMAFKDAQQQQKNKNNLMKMLTTVLGGGAGFALGGPAGALAGAKVGSTLGG